MLNRFLGFYASNEKKVNNICFLIKLGPENVNLTSSQMAILKDGVIETLEFEPPVKLITENITEHTRGYDYYKVKISWDNKWDIDNEFVVGCRAEFSHIGLVGDSAQVITNQQYFAIEGKKKEVDVKINGLKPNTLYGLVFFLVTPYGRGESSERNLWDFDHQ